MTKVTYPRRVRRGAGLVALLLAGVASSAVAQDVADDSEDAQTITVTASRVARDGYTAPTPTTVIGADALQARGATNIADVLNETPAFRASTTPQTNGVRAIFPGSNYADLRGLGSSRTLVLVDGNRFVPQITTGLAGYQVDLNQVPSLLVDRVDVVTGGASAQWGSDAVAGVVNVILKHNFEGLRAELQYGQAEQADNREYRVGLLGGTRLGDRGHLVVGFDYVKNDGVGDTYNRGWGREAWGIVANPCPLSAAASVACPTGGNGLARNLILPDVHFSTATPGGLIVSATGPAAALRNIQFGPGGTLQPFNVGDYAGTQYMQGGGNAGLNFNSGISMRPPTERIIGYSRMSYEVGSGVEAYVEGSYAHSQGSNQTLPARNEQTTPVTIRTDNPFIPDALRTIIGDYNLANPGAPITSFNLGRYHLDLGRQVSDVSTDTWRAVGGFKADMGNGWKLDGALIHGRNDYDQRLAPNRIRSNFNYAADVTVNGSGVPVCRATLSADPAVRAAAAGCVPLNLFGYGAPSQDATDYVMGDLATSTVYKQTAANLNLTGEPFSTWAGPVSLATGAEWRSESQVTRVDAIAEIAGYESTNARSLQGKFNVIEGYVETVVPLAADTPFLNRLDVNGAVRIAHYSTAAGTQVTWKVGAVWEPIEDVLIRVARSRDIRAPNIFELKTAPVSTIVNQIFSSSVDGGPVGQVATQQLTGGNENLQPEKADTFAVGVVLTPSFLPGLSLSVDYYNIVVNGAIATLTIPNVIDFCIRGQSYYCDFVTANPAGSAASYTIATPFLNLNQIQRSGFDFDATYRTRLDNIAAGLPGNLTLRFSATHIAHYRENANGAGYVERAGDSSTGLPRFQSNSSISYELERARLSLQMRTIGSDKYNSLWTEGVDISNNRVDGRTYFNLSGTVTLREGIELFGMIDNLTDRDPPIAPQNFGFPTITALYDVFGRSYRMGVRVKL